MPASNSMLATMPAVKPVTSRALTATPPTFVAIPAEKPPAAAPCHTLAVAVPVQVSQQAVA